MGSVFLRGDSWVGEYRDRGKIKRRALGNKRIITKTMAREMVKKIEQRLKLGQYDMVDAEIPNLKDFGKEYIKHVRYTIKRKSWNRYEYSLNYLNKMYGDRKLAEITPKDIDDFKEARLKYAKPATVNRELSTLRQIFNLAKRWGRFFGQNPVSMSGLLPENNMKERILTAEQEETLLSHSNPYLRPIIITALQTGMRKSEIITLKWSNVDLANGVITIEQTNTKNKKTRRIPVNFCMRTVFRQQKLRSGGSDFVFLSHAGLPYKKHDSLKGAFVRACKKAGLNDLRFHDLRHTCATRMIERGASIVAVSKILGHSDIKMTMRYSHPENSVKEAVELLSDVFSRSFTDESTDTKKASE